MHLDQLRERLRAHGAKPDHERHLLQAWVRGGALGSGPRAGDSFFPRRLRERFAQLQDELDALARVRSRHDANDGSARLLVSLADGQAIESVLLPRDGVCVSTQVGCAVGCLFCMTGRSGLIRQLGSAEIVAQAALARRSHTVKKVVFMGMGEPAHNLDAVMDAITLLGTLGDIAHKNLVFSTVGDARVFERLPLGPVKPALAVSLHSTRADLRARLLPRAPRIDPATLVSEAQDYARRTGYPIQYQWTLLAGVNDGDAEIDRLAELLAGQYAVMNMIPYNDVEGAGFVRPSWERAAEIARRLHRRGVLTKLRRSAGQDVQAGCGQLRARATDPAVALVPLGPRAVTASLAPLASAASRAPEQPLAGLDARRA